MDSLPKVVIASTLPQPQLLIIVLCVAIPALITSMINFILARVPKSAMEIHVDLKAAERKLNALRDDKANLSRNFVKISKAERQVIFLTKKKTDEETARLARAAAASKYAQYVEMGIAFGLIVLTYNKHLGTFSHPPIDTLKSSAYLKALVFPAHTFLQMLPSMLTKELDLFKGYGGTLGMFAIYYAVNKSIKRIFNVLAW
mmetsp:Transcript_12883/g.26299  ORF Transcript_12883/g.26299 Transcript_12883/m.26299 type:complete len:201 (-) Transcript_12883:40-642(-)